MCLIIAGVLFLFLTITIQLTLDSGMIMATKSTAFQGKLQV